MVKAQVEELAYIESTTTYSDIQEDEDILGGYIRFKICIYNKKTKKKTSEYGIFENFDDVVLFAKEHHIKLEN